MAKRQDYLGRFLKYDFTYEGQRHKGCIRLVEGASGVSYWYDKHRLEVTWCKTLRQRGVRLVLSIVVADDWNDIANLGKVMASGYVCVYRKGVSSLGYHLVESFEPDAWEYIDEADSDKSVGKESFYFMNADGV